MLQMAGSLRLPKIAPERRAKAHWKEERRKACEQLEAILLKNARSRQNCARPAGGLAGLKQQHKLCHDSGLSALHCGPCE